MARDTADQTLVKGAYAAAGGNIKDYGLAAAKGMTEIGDNIAETITPVIQQRAERYNAYIEKALMKQYTNDGSGVYKDEMNQDSKEFKEYVNGFKKQKYKYALGGPIEKEMLMQELTDKKIEQELENNKKRNTLQNAKNVKNKLWQATVGAQLFEDMDNPEFNNVSDPDDPEGFKGFMVDLDGNGRKFHTQEEIDKVTKSYAYDENTQNAIDLQIENIVKNPPETYHYAMRHRANTRIVDQANYMSMLESEGQIVPGRSFKNDFMEMLSNNTYESLGIRPRQVNSLMSGNKIVDGGIKDVNKDGVVDNKDLTDEDKVKIYKELISNERRGKKYLSTYLTNYEEQNWLTTNTGRKKGTFGTRGTVAYNFFDKEDPSGPSGPGGPVVDPPSGGGFNEAFAAHRKKMIDQFGSTPEGMKKWTNFNFKDRQFTPYTEEDETRIQGSGTTTVDDGLVLPERFKKLLAKDNKTATNDPGNIEVIPLDILKKDQTKAATRMTEWAKKLGLENFKFEGTGATFGRDKVTITAPNGEKKEFRIDRFKSETPTTPKTDEKTGELIIEDGDVVTKKIENYTSSDEYIQGEIKKWMQENAVELLPGYKMVNGVATKIK